MRWKRLHHKKPPQNIHPGSHRRDTGKQIRSACQRIPTRSPICCNPSTGYWYVFRLPNYNRNGILTHITMLVPVLQKLRLSEDADFGKGQEVQKEKHVAYLELAPRSWANSRTAYATRLNSASASSTEWWGQASRL